MCVCVCVCVYKQDGKWRSSKLCQCMYVSTEPCSLCVSVVCVCVCVCVCVLTEILLIPRRHSNQGQLQISLACFHTEDTHTHIYGTRLIQTQSAVRYSVHTHIHNTSAHTHTRGCKHTHPALVHSFWHISSTLLFALFVPFMAQWRLHLLLLFSSSSSSSSPSALHFPWDLAAGH